MKKDRRTKEIVKNTVIKMRITESKKNEIKNFCRENNITLSELMLSGIDSIIKNYSKI